MKKLVVIAILLKYISMQAQIYPDYKVPVPERVVLNHACQTHNIDRIYQDIGTGSPRRAYFRSILSDSAGNLYMLGKAEYDLDPNNSQLKLPITFGSNLPNPKTITRSGYYPHFVCKYFPSGDLAWVTFFNQEPEKIVWNETEKKLHALINHINYEILCNGGSVYQLDTSIHYTRKVILTFDNNNGGISAIYQTNSIEDILSLGDKIIIIYNNQDSYMYYFGKMYGFFRNNQVVKWQNSINGSTQLPTQLYYNPYENSIWYFKYAKYARMFFHPSVDSLINENIDRDICCSSNPQYGYASPSKPLFYPDGTVITRASLPTPNSLYYPNFGLMKWDTAGNFIWGLNGKINDYVLDNNGDVWISFSYFDYYEKALLHPSANTYFIRTYGNMPEPNNFLWKLNGSTGELLETYRNGHGNNAYYFPHYLHITQDNKLITTPPMGSVAYYPDASGNFKPYFTTCSNNYMTSQFMWASFDLNNLVSYKREEQSEEEVYKNYFSNQSSSNFFIYPNPNQGQFTIQTENGGVFELMDITGKVLNTYTITGNSTQTINENLPAGMYFIREKGSGFTHKLIIE